VDATNGRRPAGHRPRHRPSTRRREMPLHRELPVLLVVAFCLAVLIRSYLVQAFMIPSQSMENTLLVDDRVLVNKVEYAVRDPRRGEVVVFRGTENWAPEVTGPPPDPSFLPSLGRTIGDLVGAARPGEKDYIKRVIGLPGDRVACCDAQGWVTVNGVPIEESYIFENSPLDTTPGENGCASRQFSELTVPPGYLWVMGDHRGMSLDARCQGPVPVANVIGRAFVIVWPGNRITPLRVPPAWETFAKTHPAAAPPG
jgi:signal peptidase I